MPACVKGDLGGGVGAAGAAAGACAAGACPAGAWESDESAGVPAAEVVAGAAVSAADAVDAAGPVAGDGSDAGAPRTNPDNSNDPAMSDVIEDFRMCFLSDYLVNFDDGCTLAKRAYKASIPYRE